MRWQQARVGFRVSWLKFRNNGPTGPEQDRRRPTGKAKGRRNNNQTKQPRVVKRRRRWRMWSKASELLCEKDNDIAKARDGICRVSDSGGERTGQVRRKKEEEDDAGGFTLAWCLPPGGWIIIIRECLSCGMDEYPDETHRRIMEEGRYEDKRRSLEGVFLDQEEPKRGFNWISKWVRPGFFLFFLYFFCFFFFWLSQPFCTFSGGGELFCGSFFYASKG